MTANGSWTEYDQPGPSCPWTVECPPPLPGRRVDQHVPCMCVYSPSKTRWVYKQILSKIWELDVTRTAWLFPRCTLIGGLYCSSRWDQLRCVPTSGVVCVCVFGTRIQLNLVNSTKPKLSFLAKHVFILSRDACWARFQKKNPPVCTRKRVFLLLLPTVYIISSRISIWNTTVFKTECPCTKEKMCTSLKLGSPASCVQCLKRKQQITLHTFSVVGQQPCSTYKTGSQSPKKCRRHKIQRAWRLLFGSARSLCRS